MAIRLIALDMDGTLLNKQREISLPSLIVLKRAARRGILLTIATGRCKCDIVRYREALSCVQYAITDNGARVHDLFTDNVILEIPMRMESVLEIFYALRTYSPMFELMADDRVYAQRSCLTHIDAYDTGGFSDLIRQTRIPVEDMEAFIASRQASATKVHVMFANHAIREAAREATKNLPYDISYQMPANLEFNAKGVTKATGLSLLAEKLSIPLCDVMAIGDNINDMPMLKVVGTPVVMKNAEAEVLSYGYSITDTNDDDGAAKAIERFALL